MSQLDQVHFDSRGLDSFDVWFNHYAIGNLALTNEGWRFHTLDKRVSMVFIVFPTRQVAQEAITTYFQSHAEELGIKI